MTEKMDIMKGILVKYAIEESRPLKKDDFAKRLVKESYALESYEKYKKNSSKLGIKYVNYIKRKEIFKDAFVELRDEHIFLYENREYFINTSYLIHEFEKVFNVQFLDKERSSLLMYFKVFERLKSLKIFYMIGHDIGKLSEMEDFGNGIFYLLKDKLGTKTEFSTYIAKIKRDRTLSKTYMNIMKILFSALLRNHDDKFNKIEKELLENFIQNKRKRMLAIITKYDRKVKRLKSIIPFEEYRFFMKYCNRKQHG